MKKAGPRAFDPAIGGASAPGVDAGLKRERRGPCQWGGAQTLRRKSDARTRSRNCFGVSGGGAEGGALARFDFAAVGAALFAAFFAVVLAARRARATPARDLGLS